MSNKGFVSQYLQLGEALKRKTNPSQLHQRGSFFYAEIYATQLELSNERNSKQTLLGESVVSSRSSRAPIARLPT